MERQISPHLEVFVNNNPRCKVELENTATGESGPNINVPNIKITGHGFFSGTQELEVTRGDTPISKDDIIVRDGQFTYIVELNAPLSRRDVLKIRVGSHCEEVPIQLYRVSGRAFWVDGSPVDKPVVIASSNDSMTAIGDSDGRFEMYLSAKAHAIGIFHSSYSKSSLECWLYEVEPKKDLQLDVTMGRIEIYRLHAWEAERSLCIHFVPMSLSCVQRVVAKGYKTELELCCDKDAFPSLGVNDIRVYIGNDAVDILDYHLVGDYLGINEVGTPIFRPACFLTVPKIDHEGKPVKVAVEHKTKDLENREIREYGEGYFLGFVR